MEKDYVAECGMKNTKSSGRKAVMIKVNSDGGFFIGLDVKNNLIEDSCYGLDFALAESISLPVLEGEKLALSVMQAVGRLSRERKISGITNGLPGVIDSVTNTLISSTVLNKDDADDIYRTLNEAMDGVFVYLKNYSGLIVLAEKEFGNHEHTENMISVDIADSVGAGILIDGSDMAGKFGHMSVDFKGKRCKCGSYGCLELYASVPGMRAKCADARFMANLIVGTGLPDGPC